jgi:hypothetical protein
LGVNEGSAAYFSDHSFTMPAAGQVPIFFVKLVVYKIMVRVFFESILADKIEK